MRDLHDYRITGLHLNESSNSLTVSLIDAEGQPSADLMLMNIVNLYVDGFSLQNIILDVSVFHEKDPSFEYQRACQLLDIDNANDSVFFRLQDRDPDSGIGRIRDCVPCQRLYRNLIGPSGRFLPS
jgi:hypothetical protein